MSAWAEQPSGGSPAGSRSRPASALPLHNKRTTPQPEEAASEKLFWTPPKEWMLACMDKGQPLRRRKAYSVAGESTSVEVLQHFLVFTQALQMLSSS